VSSIAANSETPSQRLSAKEKVSYGAGEVASNLAWNVATGFLLIYYTDVALLPAAALGLLMLVTRTLDAIFDPMAGIAVDRTSSRYGKARPYLLYTPILFGLFFVATFSVPDWSTGAKLAYAYVTFTLLGLAYSFLYVPFSAMLPMLTRDPDEKIQLGSMRAMGTSLASIAAYGLAMPMVAYFGAGDRQLGFTLAATVFAVATVVLYWITFANTKERYAQPASEAQPPLQSLGKIVQNPVWRVAFGLKLLTFVRISVQVSCLAFFVKDVLGQPGLIGVILPIMSIMIFTGGAIARTWVNKFGLERGNIIAACFQMAMTLPMFLFETNTPLFVACYVIAAIPSGIGAASQFRLGADCVEWHEARFGQREEGLIASALAFGLKVGFAIGTALTGFALGWAGYTPGVPSEATNDALRVLVYGGPIIFNLLLIVGWWRFSLISREPQRFATATN
jgi:glycoside/pentoside/hexuronide:cation symporter, GPH family